MALAETLKTNTPLQKVYLQDNNIGVEGTVALAETLKTNTSLQEVYLQNNNIGEEGTVALAEALKTNTSLQIVRLKDDNISQAIYDQIRSLLSNRNRDKRRLELEKSKIGNVIRNPEPLKRNKSI